MSLFAGGDAWIKKWPGGNTAVRPFYDQVLNVRSCLRSNI
jgi:hypothetical protein